MSSLDKIFWYGVMHDQIDGVWHQVEPLVDRALKYSEGEFDREKIIAGLKKRAMQLWCVRGAENGAPIAVVVTEVIPYPGRKKCIVVLLAGKELATWIHLLPAVLEPWAKEQGCQSMVAWCREGLAYVLKGLGWRRRQVVMEKEI